MRVVGRYAVFDEIAAGGMAAVHLGRLLAEAGFSRTVAIKRLHPQLARDPDFVTMFLDEARLASRIRHPNVVQTVDIVTVGDEVLLVMEYVAGESLSRLVRAARPGVMPLSVAVSIMTAALHGLHAAHEAKTEQGVPLRLVHRDVSPQNILVGTDGVARVLDFGVAKASHRAQTTKEGQIKGKLAYMAPEVLRRDQFDRRTDVYAAAVVLWEAITGQRLFEADTEARVVMKVLEGDVVPPSARVPTVPPVLDDVVMRGLARDPEGRWATARDMAIALERCGVTAAPASEVGEWVERIAGKSLAAKAARVAEIERASDQGIPSAPISGRLLPTESGSFQHVPATGGALPDVAESASTAIATSATLGKHEARSGRGGAFAVLGTMALLGLGLGGYALAVRATPTSASTGAAPPTTDAPVERPAAPDPAPSPGAPASSAVASPQPEKTEKAEKAERPEKADPRVAKGDAKKPAPATAPPPPKKPAPAAPKSEACKVPYTVDSAGIRHLKPECL